MRSLSRLIIVVFCIALAMPAVASAKHHAYPKAIQKAFVGSCVPSAVKSGLSKHKATVYCKAALVCIEAHMSLKTFENNPSSKTVTKCEISAAKKAAHS